MIIIIMHSFTLACGATQEIITHKQGQEFFLDRSYGQETLPVLLIIWVGINPISIQEMNLNSSCQICGPELKKCSTRKSTRVHARVSLKCFIMSIQWPSFESIFVHSQFYVQRCHSYRRDRHDITKGLARRESFGDRQPDHKCSLTDI